MQVTRDGDLIYMIMAGPNNSIQSSLSLGGRK
jgi:hypothetical protein